MKDELLLLLNLELFDQLEGSRLVFSHVLVPGLGKFFKLELLSGFNVHQLFFLGQSHVLLLALLLSARELFKSELHHLCPSIISRGLSIDPKLVHDSI